MSRGARAGSAATTDEVRRAERAPGVGRRRREERATIRQRGYRRAPPDRRRSRHDYSDSLLAREHQLLERAELPEHDAALVLPDQPLGFEAPEHGVHLAHAAGGAVGERVLRDAQREHVAARVLHPEAARGLDQRRGDAGAEILREEAPQADDERDPALGDEGDQLADLARALAGEHLEELVCADASGAHVGVRGRLEDVRVSALDQGAVAEDLSRGQQVEQHAAAVRRGAREARHAREHDVETARFLPRLIDELGAAILAHLEAPLQRLALLRLESLERGEAAQRAIAGEWRGYLSPGGARRVPRLSGEAGHRAADSMPGTLRLSPFRPVDG